MGNLFLLVTFLGLAVVALRRRGGEFGAGVNRALDQAAILIPRMLCALAAAGFLAELIPDVFVARHLGTDAGFLAVVYGTLFGAVIPAGPVVGVSIAALLLKSGASGPAVMAFLSSWSVFAIHRVTLFEIPMLGWRFTRVRLLSAVFLPLAVGLVAMGIAPS
jgi:uncharacterized membrane protein YraQ (UPF0718 family)